ncbi:hypothetical protein ACJJIQ_02745 [Microbulbifer sp. ANSA003]|uniref:hypothetical protein n=1 Tax=Microbulbifer sp. ANSA003 TaxID=3243360 RepID=UPI0040429346
MQLNTQTKMTESIKFNFNKEVESIKHKLALNAEEIRKMEELKLGAYVDFVRASSGIAMAQRFRDKESEHQSMALLLDSKIRIGIYGDSDVAKAVGEFFEEYGNFTKLEDRRAFTNLMLTMRNNALGSIQDCDRRSISQILFSEAIESELETTA